MKATPAEQQDLLTLADTDEQLRLLEHKRSNLPEQQILENHVDLHHKVADELVDATRTQERLALQNTRHEREIENAVAGRKHSESLIYMGSVKTERELEARREEIEEFTRRQQDVEDSLLEIMEQSEEVGSLVDELTARRGELDSQITHLTGQRDAAATDIDGELQTLRDRRTAEASQLDGGIVTTYETLRAKRPGRVVARLQGRTCTGCQLELTAIELEEIKETAKTSLAYCQQCGSIIVPA
ncbi:hypothetical protein BH24ACT15_BH24ACT15_25200 [soil metagenome]